MFKTKKLLLGIAAVAATSTIAVTAIACGSSSYSLDFKPLTPITEKSAESFKTAVGEKKFNDLGKMILITDEGKIDDKSFNQSAWDAVRTVAKNLGAATGEDGGANIKELRPAGSGSNHYDQAYNAALSNGYKYWVLPGFNHASKIRAYWKTNEEKLTKAGVVIIAIDFDPNQPDPAPSPDQPKEKPEETTARLARIVSAKNSVSLQFKTQEAAFMVGYAAAKYLGENETNKVLNSFGGGEFPGVTDFNRGFLAGIKVYNDAATQDKRVTVAPDKVDLTSQFETGKAPMDTAVLAAVSSKAQIILPVAGPATGAVLTSIGEKDQWVIGVDVDQANTPLYANKKEKFFSSIEKRMSQATYDALVGLYDGSLKLTDTPTVWAKGFVDKWVGYATSTLPTEKAAKANAALAEAKTFWEKTENKTKIDAALKTDAEFNSKIQANLNALVAEINAQAKKTN